MKDAAMAQARTAKRGTLNLRITPDDRELIDRAAKAVGKNRTEFMLDAARNAAQETLLDQLVFKISPKRYAEFVARLDEPPHPNDRLRRTLKTPAPWD
jgi:uncharacterized protein (DUF1778 family)